MRLVRAFSFLLYFYLHDRISAMLVRFVFVRRKDLVIKQLLTQTRVRISILLSHTYFCVYHVRFFGRNMPNLE